MSTTSPSTPRTAALAATAAFTVDAAIPGGNVIVQKIEGDSVHFGPDLRTTTKPWFYWHFRVTRAGGRTLSFETDKRFMGVHGPGVSLDGGTTWQWLGADKVDGGRFSYVFPANANDVRFSVGMPYQRSHFDAFLAKHKNNPFLQVQTLTRTPKGRDVVMVQTSAVRTGTKKGKAPYAIAVTARNHACEMFSTYILEGLLGEVISDTPTGAALREQADFLFMPFMDTDGVEDGDQGKNRAPHDHNRDFGPAPLYSEVVALKKELPQWQAGRPLVFIDLHDPALKGDVHEVIHFMEPMNRDHAARMDRLTAFLDRDQQGPILFSAASTMRSGKGYNAADEKLTHASGWARSLPGAICGFTIEVPYANAGGYEVNGHSAREFGRDLALALKPFLREKPDTVKAAPGTPPVVPKAKTIEE